MSKELMTIDKLIDYLPDKPAKNTVYYWTSNGLIPFRKFGKKIFFEKSKIDNWNEQNRPATGDIR